VTEHDDYQVRDLYRLRRQVALWRQQLYNRPDPGSDGALVAALAEAEAQLQRLEAARDAGRGDSGGILLDTGGGGEKPGGIMLGAETTAVDARVLLRQSHVPTGIVHLLDPSKTPLVTFRIRYGGDEYVRLRLSSLVEGYSARAIDTVELLPDDEITIHHLPTFFPHRIRHVNELTRATLHIRIDDLDGATEQHSTFPIWLLARTSAYLGMKDPATGGWIDLLPYLGAWVTPNATGVMRLLRVATTLHPAQQIAGYQVGPAGVAQQVEAIYRSLQQEEIRYIHSALCFGVTEGEYMQRVRLPREALANKSANCIDGTVLMASLLEAASLNPALVLVPGHAFLGWEQGPENGEWDYLETTMIADHDFEAARASARRLAEQQQAQAERLRAPHLFRRLSVAELRTHHQITPME
jgi:hypothetical protein